MRLLLQERMSTVMSHVDAIMADSSFNRFHYASERSSRILSGEEEGVFAWIAANYLLGRFDSHRRTQSLMIITINTKNCSLSIVLTATDQKPQKSLKR